MGSLRCSSRDEGLKTQSPWLTPAVPEAVAALVLGSASI